MLLADADQHAREGLRRAYDGHWDLEVVGEAGSVVEAVAELDRLSPDVLVAAAPFTDGDGLMLVRQARAANQNLVIVVLAADAGHEDSFAALEAGASMLLRKDADAEEIAAAAWRAIGRPRIPSKGLVEDMQRLLRTASGSQLSPREYDVLLLLAKGLTISQVERWLFISRITAETHVANLCAKFGVDTRDEAVAAAVRCGLIADDPGK